MLDNPTFEFVSRAVLAGLGAFLGIVQYAGYENMNTADWVNAAVAGAIIALGYSGITAASPIDSSYGAKRGGGK